MLLWPIITPVLPSCNPVLNYVFVCNILLPLFRSLGMYKSIILKMTARYPPSVQCVHDHHHPPPLTTAYTDTFLFTTSSTDPTTDTHSSSSLSTSSGSSTLSPLCNGTQCPFSIVRMLLHCYHRRNQAQNGYFLEKGTTHIPCYEIFIHTQYWNGFTSSEMW